MKTGDYRRDYAAYAAALERARYDYHTGTAPELRLAPLEDRYADLWTRDSIEDLKRAREEIPTHFETERTALAALLRAAQHGYVEAHAAEVTRELSLCEESTHFDWDGAKLATNDVPDTLAVESDAARRRELSARWFDALQACHDLRAARFEALGEAARALDFNSYFGFLQSVNGEATSVENLSAQGDKSLARTASIYNKTLFAWAARHLPPELARTPVYADSLFLLRLSHLDPFSPRANCARLTTRRCRAWGFAPGNNATSKLKRRRMSSRACAPRATRCMRRKMCVSFTAARAARASIKRFSRRRAARKVSPGSRAIWPRVIPNSSTRPTTRRAPVSNFSSATCSPMPVARRTTEHSPFGVERDRAFLRVRRVASHAPRLRPPATTANSGSNPPRRPTRHSPKATRPPARKR